MDCNFAVKVSLLIDEELSSEESEKVKNHLADCAKCQQLEKDFLFFREQIKESGKVKDFELSEKKTPFGKKVIAIPAPVFVGLLITLIGLGIWFLVAKVNQSEQLAKDNPTQNQPNEVSLAKYDKGGRAEIYVAPQEQK